MGKTSLGTRKLATVVAFSSPGRITEKETPNTQNRDAGTCQSNDSWDQFASTIFDSFQSNEQKFNCQHFDYFLECETASTVKHQAITRAWRIRIVLRGNANQSIVTRRRTRKSVRPNGHLCLRPCNNKIGCRVSADCCGKMVCDKNQCTKSKITATEGCNDDEDCKADKSKDYCDTEIGYCVAG